jgi:hypothetical protein
VCTITELDDGAADTSTGPVDVEIRGPVRFDAEIVNTFDTEPATAGAVQAAPTFTG